MNYETQKLEPRAELSELDRFLNYLHGLEPKDQNDKIICILNAINDQRTTSLNKLRQNTEMLEEAVDSLKDLLVSTKY